MRRFTSAAGLAAMAVAALVLPAGGGAPRAETVAPASVGPPLWRVSRGEHELWLFGTVTTVPKDLAWDPRAVERAIAGSQEVLLPPGARAAVSLKPVHLVRAWRRARELGRNPRGSALSDVLPPELERRYAALRDRYASDDRGLEPLRPLLAAARLYDAAVAEMELESGRDVQESIERLAHRAKVASTDAQLHVDPHSLLDQAARVPKEAELDCVAKVFALIEAGDGTIEARARAWAAGDVAQLRLLNAPDIRKECLAHPGWPEGLRATLRAAEDKWFAAAEQALAENRSTFALLDMRELLAADGLLARFRERGYEVREP
jgi:uncharacterized protein YbaP (TraB family)